MISEKLRETLPIKIEEELDLMGKKFNILVVDDDLKNIQVGINFLRKNKDYHLVFATSGIQALERVESVEFDLILLDIIMPVMDGYEVCRRLKENEKTRDIPVLFLTAKQGSENIVRGFEAGGADYITKPFSSHELIARVKTHLELRNHYQKEIERLQKALNQSQKVEAIRFRVNGLVHECNNFLNAISPNIHWIKSNVKKKEFNLDAYEEYFQGIVSSVMKTSGLLKQFSELGQKNSSEPEIVNMNTVVKDITKLYKPSFKDKVELKIDFLDRPALTLAETMHIEQVLLNMIINAEHAIMNESSKDGRKGLINMRISKVSGSGNEDLKEDSDYLKIDIEDNGSGMSPETLKKIFNPYFTSKKEIGGSGLGLAIADNIVKSHKGIIQVSSEIGKGSCFSIYFPFYSGD